MTIQELDFISRRSTVYGTHGMVTSLQPISTQIGLDVLKKGGNAADAAVAMAFVAGLLDPAATSIGGNAIGLFYDSKKHKVKCLDGSGRTSSTLILEKVLSDPIVKKRNSLRDSIHSVTVPGALAAYVDTLDHFGSGRFDLAALIEPAIDMAENGFPVSEIASDNWRRGAQKMCKLGFQNDHDWLIDQSRGPEEGEVVVIPTLAKTLRKIAKEGKDGFYKGEIAEAIVKNIQDQGGFMTMKDLAEHSTEISDPISLDYHDLTIWQVPPASQGITTLMALGIIEALEEGNIVDFSKINHSSPEYFHVVAEALRIAFADVKHYIADPNTNPFLVKDLLSKEYLRERARLVSMECKNDNILNGYPDSIGNTTCMSVVDKDGNACSFMTSVSSGFYVFPSVSGTGIILQDRGCFFSLEKNHPNCIGPNKKPFHTLMPTIVTSKSKLGHEFEASVGITGLFMQHQGMVQYILNMKHYISCPQRILDLRRMCIFPSKEIRFDHNNASISNDYELHFEQGITEEVIKELESKGHICKIMPLKNSYVFGKGALILSKKDLSTGKRLLAGGSDPRADGQASGW